MLLWVITTTHCVIIQKSTVLICFAAEAEINKIDCCRAGQEIPILRNLIYCLALRTNHLHFYYAGITSCMCARPIIFLNHYQKITSVQANSWLETKKKNRKMP